MKYYILLSVIVLGLSYSEINAQSNSGTTIIFIRHAEKDTVGNDPGLTKAGKERVERVAHLLKGVEIEAVFTTPFNRTRETGQIVAEKKDVPLVEYNPFKTDIVHQWKEEYLGKAIVVVGHSNTVPALVNLLMEEDRIKKLSEDDYDQMYIVMVPESGKPGVININTSADL